MATIKNQNTNKFGHLPLNFSTLATHVVVETVDGSTDPFMIFFYTFVNSIGHATITSLSVSQLVLSKLSGSSRVIHRVSPISHAFSFTNSNRAYFMMKEEKYIQKLQINIP